MRKILVSIMALAAFVLLSTSVSALAVSINNYDPAPAEAGRYVNVWLKVENPSSGSLSDLFDDFYLEVKPSDGLVLAEGEEARKKIGTLNPGQSQTIQYRLFVRDDAVEGPNLLQAVLIEGDQETETDVYLEVVDKDFFEVDLQVGDVESDPSRIKPDDDNVELKVTLLNLEDGRAQSVRAELINLPEGITLSESYSGTSLLGNILGDGSAEATFYIDVSEVTEPREHIADIKLTYKFKPDEDENDYVFEEVLVPLRIAVRPTPLYEITDVAFDKEVLRAGERNVKMTVTLENVGQEEGESVRFKVYGKTEQPFTIEDSSDFVSPLMKPGDTGQATIEFNIKESANIQTYYLDVEIKNVLNDDVITYNKKVAVDITQPKADNPWSVVSIGIVIFVIALIVIVVTRVRSKNKKSTPKKVKGSYGESFMKKK